MVAVASLAFHTGLLLCAGALSLLSASALRRGRSTAVLWLNTLVCLLVGIVLLDPILYASQRAASDELVSYSFVEAQGRPEVFLRWQERSNLEQERTRSNRIPDPRGINPPINAPGREGRFFESKWWINSLGFRGARSRERRAIATASSRSVNPRPSGPR